MDLQFKTTEDRFVNQEVYNLISCHQTWSTRNKSRVVRSKRTKFMIYQRHCDDSSAGMFKMASSVSFVTQFLDGPAESANHKDAEFN